MKKIPVQIWCMLCGLLCLTLWGCGGEQSAAVPVGRVYQPWPCGEQDEQSEQSEWRPCYLYWLGDNQLLVGSAGVVKAPAENSQNLSYLEQFDLETGSSVAANSGQLTANWFYDVRALADPATGLIFLQRAQAAQSAVFICDPAAMTINSTGELALPTGNPWIYMGQIRAQGRWQDWALEVGPGQLWQTPVAIRNPQVGEPVLLAEAAAVGRDMAAFDVSPDQRRYVQLNYDGLLVEAELSDGLTASRQLEPPVGWVDYSGLLCLPEGEALAVTVLCEDKTVVQVLDKERQVAFQAEWPNEEDMALLAAPDGERLLLAGKKRVELLNWQSGEVEAAYDADTYQKLAWGCANLAAPENLHRLLDPAVTRGFVQYAAYDGETDRLAVIKYLQEEQVSQLIVLDNWVNSAE